jgi:spermidine synthase
MKLFLLFIFFLSGGCGLGYELLWTRYLELIFGNTTFSTAAILSSFMLGFAIGALGGSKLCKEKGFKALPYYLLCELLIGIFALFSPIILSNIHYLLLFLSKLLENNFYIFSIFKFLFVIMVLFIPTTLMGATFPFMIEAISSIVKYKSKWSSLMYAANLVGAAMSILFSLLFFLPRFNLDKTIYLFALINILIFIVGFTAYKYYRNIPPITKTASFEYIKPFEKPQKVILFLYLICGICSFALEIVWTRYYILLAGGSIYSFGFILFAWIIGLGIGSFLISFVIEKIKDYYFAFSLLCIVSAILVCSEYLWITLTPYFYMYFYPSAENIYFKDTLPWLYKFLSPYFKYAFEYKFFIKSILIFIGIIGPTVCIGMTLPVLLKGLSSQGVASSVAISFLYIFNCLGAVVGSWLVSFLLIPLLGLRLTNNLIAFLYVVVFFVTLEFFTYKKEIVKIAILIVVIFLLGGVLYLQTTTHTGGLSSGVYLYGVYYTSLEGFVNNLEKKKNLFSYEGLTSIVDVKASTDSPFNLALYINGKVDASSFYDLDTQIFSGHLGMFYNKNVRNVLIIGLGSGITAGSVGLYPHVEKIDIVEIEKGVIEAAKKYFANDNYNILNNSKTNLIIDDARSFVFFTPKKYDLIISEPSNPWLSGASSLFTKEFFEIIKSKLNDDGVFVQWFHLYHISSTLVKSLFKAFLSAFPEVAIHCIYKDSSESYSADILLVGSKKKLQLDYHHLEAIFSQRKIRKDLLRIELYHPAQIINTFYLANNDIKNFAHSSNIPTNSDKNMLIEFSAAKYLENRELVTPNHKEMQDFKTIFFPTLLNYDYKKLLEFNFIYQTIERIPADNLVKATSNILKCYLHSKDLTCAIALFYLYIRNAKFDIAQKFLNKKLKKKVSQEVFLNLLLHLHIFKSPISVRRNILIKMNRLNIKESVFLAKAALYFRDINDIPKFFKFLKKAIKKDRNNLALYNLLLTEAVRFNRMKEYTTYYKIATKKKYGYRMATKLIYKHLYWIR